MCRCRWGPKSVISYVNVGKSLSPPVFCCHLSRGWPALVSWELSWFKGELDYVVQSHMSGESTGAKPEGQSEGCGCRPWHYHNNGVAGTVEDLDSVKWLSSHICHDSSDGRGGKSNQPWPPTGLGRSAKRSQNAGLGWVLALQHVQDPTSNLTLQTYIEIELFEICIINRKYRK